MQDIDKSVVSVNISYRSIMYVLLSVIVIVALIVAPERGWWSYQIDPLSFLALAVIAYYMEKIDRRISFIQIQQPQKDTNSNLLVVARPSKITRSSKKTKAKK
jgi:hypothetical protein